MNVCVCGLSYEGLSKGKIERLQSQNTIEKAKNQQQWGEKANCNLNVPVICRGTNKRKNKELKSTNSGQEGSH